MAILSKLCTAALLAVLPCTTALSLSREYSGDNFTSGFEFRTAADYPGSGDPTGGFVNYLSESDATAKGLVKVVNGQVYLGADSTTTLSTSVQGRDSIRMEATESFTNGLLIADIAHMPGNGCGVWPAFWTFNFDEDPYGEIDIIEGAMHQLNNIVSLHTCGTCQFTFSGTDPRSNCNLGGEAQGCADAGVTNADGCGNTAPSGSYGDRFNSIGGGVYATYVQASSLKIWFFPRSSIPADIASGNPNPSNWPAPFLDAEQSGKGCNVGNFFKKQTLIINTDFCGAMIDQGTWDADSTCSSKASTCVDFVAKNPSAFTEAYWLFNSIQLYQ
ncbi:concanavalin A-like lectin/glucanase domain-containing protein [Diplogelasinospora grovesii]|uniref:Concanavalin A-like lectin/glucanase domain-containing protein n=1 Tax=Diplogelasinospora grovesii TaxID=303347 RepID=A0AAN6S1H3_9PEZI|nr:concanavalin A-like lectin/glucanase domain-containing protein [Diplogelasinospora grovesii]